MAHETEEKGLLARRNFIRWAGLSALWGPMLLHNRLLGAEQESPGDAGAESSIPRRQMGKLKDVKVAMLIGNESMSGGVFKRAIDMGVNYWHKFGGRDRFALIKQAGRENHFCEVCRDPRPEAATIVEEVKKVLMNTGVDHFDFYKSHLRYTPAAVEAYYKMKEEGIVRWFAASIHGNMKTVRKAVDEGHLHQVQVAVNALAAPDVWETVEHCRQKGVGFIAMKAMLGGPGKWNERKDLRERLAPYLPSDGSIAKALIKALTTGARASGMTGVVVVCRAMGHLEENAGALAEPMTEGEARGLDILTTALASDVCRMCYRCTLACPRRIPVTDILRYSLYAQGYGERDRAHRLYGQLRPEQQAAACDECGLCEKACPYGIGIMAKLTEADRMLA